jgi:hypothetical protein
MSPALSFIKILFPLRALFQDFFHHEYALPYRKIETFVSGKYFSEFFVYIYFSICYLKVVTFV